MNSSKIIIICTKAVFAAAKKGCIGIEFHFSVPLIIMEQLVAKSHSMFSNIVK